MYVYSFILVWYISSHIIFKTQSPKLHELVIATNFPRWTVLTLYIQFLPAVLHSRLLTNHLLILSKLLSLCRAMAITYLLIPWLLQRNILSHGSEFMMLGSCVWQMHHLLPCQISLGTHFCQLTSPYWRRGKPRQHAINKKS